MRARNALAYLMLALLVTSATAVAQQTTPWQTDLEAAKRLAAQTNRLVLIHFWAPWCQPCLRLEQEVLSQPGLTEALANNFVPVRLNYDEHTSLAREFDIRGIPADVIMTPTGQLVRTVQSPATMSEYLRQMREVAMAASGQGAVDDRYANYNQQGAAQQSPQSWGQQASGVAPSYQTPGYQTPGYEAPSYQPSPGDMPQWQAGNPQAPNAQVASPQVGASYGGGRYDAAAQAAAAAAPDRYGHAPSSTSPAYTDSLSNATAASNTDRYAADTAASRPAAVTPPRAGSMMSRPTQDPQSQGSQSQGSQSQNPASQGNPAYGTAGSMEQTDPTSQVAVPSWRRPPQQEPESPLGLDGYCPVTLAEEQRWALGDRRWGAVHEGRTYLFTGPEQQRRFLNNPNAYGPVNSGYDPVLSLDHNQTMPGFRQHGVFYNGQVFLFNNEASLATFARNPQRYMAGIQQAMRPAAGPGIR